MNLNTYFSYWAELYKEDMMNNIMPFWMKYGLDTQNGGIYTCVDATASYWIPPNPYGSRDVLLLPAALLTTT